MAEIEGQVFEPTSGLTFLHRAWKRLSAQRGQVVPDVLHGAEKSQRLMMAGDTPFNVDVETRLPIPDRYIAMDMLAFYFDVCVVTYRFLHRQTVSLWLEAVVSNAERNLPVSHDLGRPKAAAVLGIMAIAALRQEKLRDSLGNGNWSLESSDRVFCAASKLTEAETGLPKLESAQARLIQVLYLLQTARMNQAWYTFGNCVQVISTLGLHRQAGKRRNGTLGTNPSTDYISAQCRKRTFWVAYILDKYLSVVLGRPRYYHDDDIDQDFPDLVNDEDMAQHGALSSEPLEECQVEALILHAKLAQIIGNTSREVYSIKHIPNHERVSAAHRMGEQLHEWRASLPPHLGTIKPATLMPSFRRQAIALKLAYSHAIMHANRTFLLENVSDGGETAALQARVAECLSAAKVALETVDSMAGDGTLFYAFWWTNYVTFCALAVIYVWEIQQGMGEDGGHSVDKQSLGKLFDLAERCQSRLARTTAADSPTRRYSVILEELRLEAKTLSARNLSSGQAPEEPVGGASARSHALNNSEGLELGDNILPGQGEANFFNMPNPLEQWETTDWLDLDSSAFSSFLDFNSPPTF